MDARLVELQRRRQETWPFVGFAIPTGACRADADFLFAKNFGHSMARWTAGLFPEDLARLAQAAERLGESDQTATALFLDPRLRVALRTALEIDESGLDVDPQRAVLHGKHPHSWEPNETFEHDGCTVIGHRSPEREVVLDTHIVAGLLCCSTDPTPLKSDDPRYS